VTDKQYSAVISDKPLWLTREQAEILHVACDHGEAVALGGGHDQAIHYRQGAPGQFGLGGELRPAVQGSGIGIMRKDRRTLQLAVSNLERRLHPEMVATLESFIGRRGGDVFHNLMLVSIRKSYPGQARKVMNAIWSLGQAMFTKLLWLAVFITGTSVAATVKLPGGTLTVPGGSASGASFTHAGTFKIVFYVCLALLVLAVLDYAYQRWQYEQSLKMTKQEVKDERKQSEGDPQVKARIRSLQRQAAYQQMMAEVPKSDVVITNPTHLAIALRFNPSEMAAPRVVAKGADFIAERIREIAREHRVPVVENKTLARALYKMAEIGDYVPVDLYRAVAEVLAYVYRLKGKYSL